MNEIKKPERKKFIIDILQIERFNTGFNQCWDEYEKYLPSEKEIRDICIKSIDGALFYLGSVGDRLNLADRKVIENYVAKAISKRIGN